MTAQLRKGRGRQLVSTNTNTAGKMPAPMGGATD